MVTAQITVRPSRISTGRQRSMRRHFRGMSFSRAIRLAADRCFRFSRRAAYGKALWSETERAWLGNDTFLHWAIWLDDIDIPWAVATAADAPENEDERRDAVRAELASYWAEQMADLPRGETPAWLPLP